MDQTKDLQKMLELIPGPAFAASDGHILHCNREAACCMLEPGMALAQLLLTGKEEYEALTDGCLYLQLQAAERTWGASVTRLDEAYLFRLESEGIPTEIKAMSLLCSELRYPVNTLSLLADKLLSQADGGKETATIHQELSRILRIFNNVSNTELCLAGGKNKTEAQELCALLGELLEECAALLEQAGITVSYTLPDKPIYSLVNTQALRQSVYNLLDNAAKYTPEGGTIYVSVSRSGQLVRLCVRDQGEGIPVALRSSIFSRYARHPGIEDSRHSLGLGLALVRASAAAHGGTVLVDTPEGGGTRVTMTLQIQSNTTALRAPSGMKIVSSADDGRVMLSDVLPVSVYDPKK